MDIAKPALQTSSCKVDNLKGNECHCTTECSITYVSTSKVPAALLIEFLAAKWNIFSRFLGVNDAVCIARPSKDTSLFTLYRVARYRRISFRWSRSGGLRTMSEDKRIKLKTHLYFYFIAEACADNGCQVINCSCGTDNLKCWRILRKPFVVWLD